MERLSQLLARHMRTPAVRVVRRLDKLLDAENFKFSNVKKFSGNRKPEPLSLAESTFLGLIALDEFEKIYRQSKFSVMSAEMSRAADGSASFTVTFASDDIPKLSASEFVAELNVFRRSKGLKSLTQSTLQAELESEVSQAEVFENMKLFKDAASRNDMMLTVFNLGDCTNTPLISRCLLVPEFKAALEWHSARAAAVACTTRASEDIVVLLLSK